jgi:hypothetical protein
MSKNKTELIEISESWDGRGDQYGGTLTDATADAATDMAAAIVGFDERSYGRALSRDASLCKSLDGIAAAIRELAEAVRERR